MIEKTELSCKTGNVSTVRLASTKTCICPKLNIATADIHVLKRDIYVAIMMPHVDLRMQLNKRVSQVEARPQESGK